jgi:hypothetical protein
MSLRQRKKIKERNGRQQRRERVELHHGYKRKGGLSVLLTPMGNWVSTAQICQYVAEGNTE